MHQWKKTAEFYAKPFAIIILLNILFFLVYGSYFESYEGTFSTFVHGTYTSPCTSDWNVDVHFLLFAFYAYINQFFPDIQIYGILLFTYNWLALIFIGLVIYRILFINLNCRNYFTFILVFSILSIDNLINLSSDRISFILSAAIFGYIESNRLNNERIIPIQWLVISATITLASFIRVEVVLILSGLYFLILLIHMRLYKIILLPIVISGIVFISYNILMNTSSNEARQAYYYKEIDFFTRKNIDYKNLNTIQLNNVNALFNCIMDKEHFTLKFYDSISKVKKNSAIKSIFGSYNKNDFIYTLHESIPEFKQSWCYILFFIVSQLFLLYHVYNRNSKWLIYLFGINVFPFLILFHIHTVARFLIPYYTIAGCINIFYVLKYKKHNTLMNVVYITILTCIIFKTFEIKNKYKILEKISELSIHKLESISITNKEKKPLIISNYNSDKFSPVSPLKKMHRQNVLVLNFYYFNAYDCYQKKWRKYCNCNPLSLEEKINYIVSSKSVFITDDLTFINLQEYYKMKYHKVLNKKIIMNFDKNQKIVELYFEPLK